MEGSLEERERQFEAKFAHDQEIAFKIRAHRDRLFAAWAADQLGDGGSPDYVDALTAFAFGRKEEDMIEKVVRDLHDAGVATAQTKVRRAFTQCAGQARDEVMNAVMPVSGA